MAATQPNTAALKIPRGRFRSGEIDYLALSFAELRAEADAWARRLATRGVRRGDRTLLMVRPGLPLIAAAFALFRIGAVPVIIDPGMGLRGFLACVARSRPRVLVGIPLAQLVSRISRRPFASVEIRIRASGALTNRLAPAKQAGDPAYATSTASAALVDAAEAAPGDLAAVLFTSGSTGAPKGVRYEHGMFEAQVERIRETYAIEPGEIDLPLLPIFALFNPALGMTSVIPEIDPSRPAAADPSRLVQAIRQERVTNSFGSPTLWGKIAAYCAQTGATLPSLRRVLCAGAPVPADLWKASRVFLPNGLLHSPYGATEALPVSTLCATQVDPDSVRGACLGRPVCGIEARIIAIDDGPIAELGQAQRLEPCAIGEIVVSGPVVTREYDSLPQATAAAKIQDRLTGETWHRMGDCGFADESGRLWFCGRQVERVETADGILFTEPCEQVFRAHPRARRCALIGIPGAPGAASIPKRPAIVVEIRIRNSGDAAALAAELRALALRHPHTAGIGAFCFHPRFPVDVRHNAKIHRLTLASWAASGRLRVLETP